MKKNFLSSKNAFTVALLWSVVVGLFISLFLNLIKNTIQFPPIIILSVAIFLLLWILLDTRYVIKNGLLLYRSGPIRGVIKIENIKKNRKSFWLVCSSYYKTSVKH